MYSRQFRAFREKKDLTDLIQQYAMAKTTLLLLSFLSLCYDMTLHIGCLLLNPSSLLEQEKCKRLNRQKKYQIESTTGSGRRKLKLPGSPTKRTSRKVGVSCLATTPRGVCVVQGRGSLFFKRSLFFFADLELNFSFTPSERK